MKRDPAEVQALFRRWCKGMVLVMLGLTVVICLAYVTLDGHKTVSPRPSISAWKSLPLIYLVFVAYGAINWRSVKRAFLAGKSADEAMKAKP